MVQCKKFLNINSKIKNLESLVQNTKKNMFLNG
jgi:hypothetical protein